MKKKPDTSTASGAAIKRYKIGYHTDEWGVRSSTPGGITDPSGQWVLYKDHIAALASAPAQAAPQPAVQQGDAMDAARYHYLRDVPMERWPAELLTAIRLQQNAKWDTNIDAARAAQEGKSHEHQKY